MDHDIRSDLYDQFETCTGCCCETYGVPYDCQSVMHYARDQMSKNGGDTIIALDSDSCYIPPWSEWNYHEPIMSENDIMAVDLQYAEFC